MRPIVHPAKEDVTLEAFFYALSNATRLKIIANLYRAKNRGEDFLNCAHAVTGIEQLPASTTSHHFRILREGGLVHSERVGKDCNNSLRIAEMDARFDGLFSQILSNLEGSF
jgi:DNA-binding transcriptional ArsR family regulator